MNEFSTVRSSVRTVHFTGLSKDTQLIGGHRWLTIVMDELSVLKKSSKKRLNSNQDIERSDSRGVRTSSMTPMGHSSADGRLDLPLTIPPLTPTVFKTKCTISFTALVLPELISTSVMQSWSWGFKINFIFRFFAIRPSLQEMKMKSCILWRHQKERCRKIGKLQFFSIDLCRVETAIDSTPPLPSKNQNIVLYTLQFRFLKRYGLFV